MRLAFSGLSSWTNRNVDIVLPSRLLAEVGYQQFTLEQLGQGHESWQRPSITSMGAWLTRCWQEARHNCLDTAVLLSSSQERLVWKQIIEQERTELFDADATARMAAHAARTIAEWEIPVESSLWQSGGDASQFDRWFRLFRQRCHRENWMSHGMLWHSLANWISGRACAASGEIAFPLTGPIFPALRRVFAALGDRALPCIANAGPSRKPAPAKKFDNFYDELEFAARWARQAFEREPSRSIGIFIPNLRKHRSDVERAFMQVFYPGACRSILDNRPEVSAAESRVFRIGASATLASEPLVSGALLLLNLAEPRISVSDAGAILRSPWVAGEGSERTLRALADMELRKKRELDVTLRDLESASVRCLHLSKIWPGIRRVVGHGNQINSFARWSQFVGDLLQATGWPGDQELNSFEQDAFESWRNALSQLSALSLVSTDVSFESAVGELRRLLEVGFERRDLASPVQILDSSQAAGLHFDTALLAGLSEETWPPVSSGFPFVPLKLQREYQVPGSSPQNLRLDRERSTASLFSVAPDVVATFSQRLSPLVSGFVSSKPFEFELWTGATPWQSYKPAVLEEKDDSVAPVYQPPASTRGGTSVIKAQSLCPFRAFAEFRLNAQSPEEGCLGLDARERGGNLHQALQLVWQTLCTRDRLRATSQSDLEQLVEAAARQAVKHSVTSAFSQIVAAVEIERLKAIILDWLTVERERQQDFTVETVEEEKYFDLAGLRLRLRLDRIDRLPGGQLLLIDYKSGDQTSKKLEGERPEEPQLFVYASSLEEDIAGLFFGQLKPREPRLKGISQSRQIAGAGNQVRKDWDTFLLEGKNNVYRLAEQFRSGYAVVDPLRAACDFCAQKPFCRIHEAGSEGKVED